MREDQSLISSVLSETSVVKVFQLDPKNRTARASLHGPPGGLFGIDQEVVTLRGLLWQLRVLQSNSRHDLMPESNPTHRLVCGL